MTLVYGISLSRIFPQKDRIADSGLIRENAGQRKLIVWHVLQCEYLQNAAIHGYSEKKLDENVQRFFQLLILSLRIMSQISANKHRAPLRLKEVLSPNKRLSVISAASQQMTFVY